MKQEEKDKITKMKQQYEQIPVSKEAKIRMKQGMERAKREEKRGKIIRLAKRTGIGCAAALAAIIVLANSNQAISLAMEKIPIIGSITKVVTLRNYTDEKENYEADVSVPQVTVEGEAEPEVKENLDIINKSIEEYAKELIEEYEEELKKEEGHYTLESSYEIVRDTEKYLAIRINTLRVQASGFQSVKLYNIDKTTGKIIELKDLLDSDRLQQASNNILEQMREQMQADEGKIYFIFSDEEPTGFQGLIGEENFYINEKGELVIIFDEYEVAPGYMGTVEFVIPKELVKID